MENLSNDPLFLIAIEMDLPDMLRWCQVNKKNANVCAKDSLWLALINRDFKKEMSDAFIKALDKYTKNNKEKYILLYQLKKLQSLEYFKRENLHDIFRVDKVVWPKNLSILKEIVALKKLTRLTLTGRNIIQIPEFIFQLGSLNELDVNTTSISSISKNIGNLKDLTTLSLNSNRIQELPEEIGLLKNLKRLYLRDNKLTALPESIGNLTQLIQLGFSNNQVRKLPDLSNLHNLESLLASGNKLKEIPDYFNTKNMPKLREVFVMHNPLNNWPFELELAGIIALR